MITSLRVMVSVAVCAAAMACDRNEETKGEEPHSEHAGHEESEGEAHEDHDDHEKGEGKDHGEHAGHEGEKEGHDEHEEGVVELSEAAFEHMGIRVEKATHRNVVDALRLTAEVHTDPDRIAHITPLVASQVVKANVRPGDRVKKNQALATLKSVELGEARAAIAGAKAGVDVAKDRFERQKQLRDAGIGAQRSYVEAEGSLKRAKAALASARARASVYGASGGSGATTIVRSPLAGTVIDRHATAGEVASPDRTLFVIADISRVWVVARAYEADIAKIRNGTNVAVRVRAYPKRVWKGEVAYVSPVLDERTRTTRVRVELENPKGMLRPGMFASVVLLPEHANDPDGGHSVLAVPSSALQRDGDGFVVFVQEGERKFERRKVTVGRRGVEHVEVLSGITAGERVVVEGTFLLKSEAAKAEMGGGHSH